MVVVKFKPGTDAGVAERMFAALARLQRTLPGIEYVRDRYTHKAAGENASYFRAIDVETGKPTPPFARG